MAALVNKFRKLCFAFLFPCFSRCCFLVLLFFVFFVHNTGLSITGRLGVTKKRSKQASKKNTKEEERAISEAVGDGGATVAATASGRGGRGDPG